MAKKTQTQQPGKIQSPGRKKRGMGRSLGFVIIFSSAFLFFLPTAVFLFLAMLPTFSSLVADRTPRKYLGITVGGLNVSGMAPYLLDLWLNDHSIPHALTILSQILPWMVILGASGLGWLLFSSTPALVAAVITMTAGRRLQTLKARQRQLLLDWGDEVASSIQNDGTGGPSREEGLGAGAQKS